MSACASAAGGPERAGERGAAADAKRPARKRSRTTTEGLEAEDMTHLGAAASLPHQAALEAGFGTSLGGVRVRVGPDARTLLDAVGGLGGAGKCPRRGCGRAWGR